MDGNEGAALIWCPFGDEESAAAVAGALLDEGLIACANFLPAIRSMFVWKGERGEGLEFAVLFKTTPALLKSAVARLEELHPYESPAICGWTCDVTGRSTTAWLGELSAP